MKNLLKNNIWSLLLILLTVVVSFTIYQRLPDTLATHFDLYGNPDNFSTKKTAFLMLPLIGLLFIFMVNGLILISPEKFAAKQSTYSIAQVVFAIVAFLMTLHGALLYSALSETQIMPTFLPVALSLLIIFLGNYMGKIERNFWVGFRTPWTLNSDENWKRTHRLGGLAYVISGLIALVVSVWTQSLVAPLLALFLASFFGVIYSYVYYYKYEKMDRRT